MPCDRSATKIWLSSLPIKRSRSRDEWTAGREGGPDFRISRGTLWHRAGGEDPSVRTTFQNEGELCLRSPGDGSLRVRVLFPGCLSSTCDRPLATSCSVNVVGGELI